MGVKVRKRKGQKSWCIVIGQRETKTVGSREAAERVKREIEARLALGGLGALEPEKPTLPTLKAYAGDWLKNVEHERKPSTAGFYSQYLRLYVLPKFGELTLDNVKRKCEALHSGSSDPESIQEHHPPCGHDASGRTQCRSGRSTD